MTKVIVALILEKMRYFLINRISVGCLRSLRAFNLFNIDMNKSLFARKPFLIVQFFKEEKKIKEGVCFSFFFLAPLALKVPGISNLNIT